jgi:hypothetical protein
MRRVFYDIGFGLTFLISAMPVNADQPASQSPIYHVQQVDPSFDVNGLAGPGVQVHSSSKADLPDVQVRNQIIAKAGLEEDVKNWDELDKDLLYVRAKKAETSADLKKKYPSLPGTKLGKLIQLTLLDKGN